MLINWYHWLEWFIIISNILVKCAPRPGIWQQAQMLAVIHLFFIKRLVSRLTFQGVALAPSVFSAPLLSCGHQFCVHLSCYLWWSSSKTVTETVYHVFPFKFICSVAKTSLSITSVALFLQHELRLGQYYYTRKTFGCEY